MADVELSAPGRAQDANLTFADQEWTAVWTSDLRRCVETARLAGIKATPTAALREFDFGHLEGKRWQDLDPATQQGLVDFDSFVAPGGESVAGFLNRVYAFAEALEPGYHLAFTHGGVIRAVLRRWGTDTIVAPASCHDVRIESPRAS